MAEAPWDAQLAWYIRDSDGDMGLRSSFGAVVSRMEGSGGQGDPTVPSYDRDAVKRLNQMAPLWKGLTRRSRQRLSVHYSERPLPPKAEARLGRLARVALLLAHEAGQSAELLRALQGGRGLDGWRDGAREAILEAHREFWSARDGS